MHKLHRVKVQHCCTYSVSQLILPGEKSEAARYAYLGVPVEKDPVEKAHLEPTEYLHKNANLSYSALDYFATDSLKAGFISICEEVSNTIWRLPQR